MTDRKSPRRPQHNSIHTQKLDPWMSLAQAVVYQAVLDWKTLDAGRDVHDTNYISLRQFFKSQWCELLLTFSGLNPDTILSRLEAHTKEVAQ